MVRPKSLQALPPPKVDPQVFALPLRGERDPHLRYRKATEQVGYLRALVTEIERVRAEAAAEMADEPMTYAQIAKEIGLSLPMVGKLVPKGERSLGLR